jgi:hypothetical protein
MFESYKVDMGWRITSSNPRALEVATSLVVSLDN